MDKLKRIADEKRLNRLRTQRGSKLALSDIGAMAGFSDFEFKKDDCSEISELELIGKNRHENDTIVEEPVETPKKVI